MEFDRLWSKGIHQIAPCVLTLQLKKNSLP